VRAFRSRLVIGHAALLVLMLVLGVTAVVGLHVSSSRLEQTGRTLNTDLLVAEQLRFRAEQVVASTRRYLLSPTAETRGRFDVTVARVDESLAKLQDLGLALAPVEIAVRNYLAVARAAVERRGVIRDSADMLPFYEASVVPARDQLDSALAQFVDQERAMFERGSTDARSFATRTQQFVLFATALGLVLGSALAAMSIRRLNAMFVSEHEATVTARRAVNSRDEVLAIVSHDLRSPLQTINLATDTLRDGERDRLAQTSIRAIERATTRMQELIDQLLDLAALDRGPLAIAPAPCRLDELVDGVVTPAEIRAAAAGISLRVSTPGSIEVVLDRARILQVLGNLIDNAIKHTPAGGMIELSITVGEKTLRFEVRDSGPGIPAAQLEQVFVRYWRGSTIGRGSLGLGLHICKEIVVAHGGEIGVDSEVGRGSTFWFAIPVTAARDGRGLVVFTVRRS
jgi:signal transduction histidine kinase